MTPRGTALLRTIADYEDEHPEWWVLVLSVGAWAAMLPHLFAFGVPCHQLSFGADLRAWLFMVLAMMTPMMMPSVRWTAERSLRSRQRRAMVGYLAGYLSPWVVLGVGVALLLGRPWTHTPWLAPVVFALAAGWAATPLYTFLIGESHRTIPLAPLGLAADRDCLLFGLRQGLPCAASCSLLMVGCALTGHGLVAMVGGAALGASERLAWRDRPWVVPAGCAGLALWYGAMALHPWAA